MSCFVEECSNRGVLRCSRCQQAYYCSKEHQKIDWKHHKTLCRRVINDPKEVAPKMVSEENKNEVEKRMCRCMFCGENLLLSSEDEAVAHMGVCPALQEQLSSKEQITVPTMVKEKMHMK